MAPKKVIVRVSDDSAMIVDGPEPIIAIVSSPVPQPTSSSSVPVTADLPASDPVPAPSTLAPVPNRVGRPTKAESALKQAELLHPTTVVIAKKTRRKFGPGHVLPSHETVVKAKASALTRRYTIKLLTKLGCWKRSTITLDIAALLADAMLMLNEGLLKIEGMPV
jgi:hypothetical protein